MDGMDIVIIVFMVIASLFSLGSLGYVSADIVYTVRHRNDPVENPKGIQQTQAAASQATPNREVMPEFVDHISASEADAMISNALAMKNAQYEKGGKKGQQGIVNIGTLDENFEKNDVVTLAALKEKGLISPATKRVKILAHGELNKPLTVKAENYSIQAIKMIELTGGTVVILKD